MKDILVLPWCEKMRISERLISDVFIENIWMVLKKMRIFVDYI